MAATPSKVSLKLLIDKKGKRVLFAEAGKDFVDFLFHILSMPLASVVKIITKNNLSGSLGRLYESIETMSDTSMQPDVKKSTILNPNTSTFAPKIPLLSSSSTAISSNMRGLYRFHSSGRVTDGPLATCPVCQFKMGIKKSFVAGPSCGKDEKAKTADQGCYVKGVVTYMIMDDLSVKPMSVISSLSQLSKFGIQDLGAVEEKLINVTIPQGVEILKIQCSRIQFLQMYFSPVRSLKGVNNAL